MSNGFDKSWFEKLLDEHGKFMREQKFIWQQGESDMFDDDVKVSKIADVLPTTTSTQSINKNVAHVVQQYAVDLDKKSIVATSESVAMPSDDLVIDQLSDGRFTVSFDPSNGGESEGHEYNCLTDLFVCERAMRKIGI